MQLVDTNDIAEMVKLSKRHVANRLIFRKDFPDCYRIGASRRWDVKDIERWIRSQRTSVK